LAEIEQTTGSNEQFVSLSPRGTSGERAGERGIPHKAPPLPGPLLLHREEREKTQGAESMKGN